MMETFLILSSRDLLRAESSPEICDDLLRGVSLQSLVQYASVYCHNLTAAAEAGSSEENFFSFQDWFVRTYAPARFHANLSALLSHRRAYRGKRWALTDQHRVGSLVLAYARANRTLPLGEVDPEQFERLLRAQLVVNDLVSTTTDTPMDQVPIAGLLPVFSMAQAADARAAIPRAFDLILRRLPKHLPAIDAQVRDSLGVGLDDSAIVLLALYLYLSNAVPGTPWQGPTSKPPWTRGILTIAELDLRHSGEATIRKVLENTARAWDDLHNLAEAMSPSDPSLVRLLERPLVRIDAERVWCFDPGLLLTAASNGPLFIAARGLVDPADPPRDYEGRPGPAGPPFKPCVRISRTRLADGLRGVACVG
ncbi:MAG: hypothetical protein M0000_08180 [Actinomycetota bacterium]|nr:hypothetical protein [Actinomycetota bacterium]